MRNGLPLQIVHELNVDVSTGKLYTHPGRLPAADHLLPYPTVPGVGQLLASLRCHRVDPYCTVFPSLRLTFSSLYLTPLPLYGSGG